MPELPEVETSRRGIEPHILGQSVQQVIVRQAKLRWPVPEQLQLRLAGQTVEAVRRRAKYLLLETARGTLIIHLGMSGNLRVGQASQVAGKHDHVDVIFADQTLLRFNDPRKFGAVLWTEQPWEQHPLLATLGPEPLTPDFSGHTLFNAAQKKRRTPVKTLIMDGHIVVGVGNIYANEALFMTGLHPAQPAGTIALHDYQQLAAAIKTVLEQAIAQGGTTLRDFVNEQGRPGYFQQTLQVYGRAGQPCVRCTMPVEVFKLGQRASYCCLLCQPLIE